MIMKDGKIQKGNDAIAERRDSKDISAKDKGRHLNFHDWILTREIRMLDQAYDEQIYILSNDILNIAHISDSDKRDEAYKSLCETRDSIRATYIWRRNELKGQFSENSQRGINKFKDVSSDDIIKPLSVSSVRGKRAELGCVDEITFDNFGDDPCVKAILHEANISKKPETNFIFNDHSDLKNVPGVTMNDLIDILSEQEEP